MEKETVVEISSDKSPQKCCQFSFSLPFVIALLVIFAVFGGVVGYAVGSKLISTSVSTPTSISNPNEEESKTDPTADWKIYTNNEYGFSMKYPMAWTTIEPREGYVRVSPNRDESSEPGPNWYFSVTAEKQQPVTSFDQWVDDKETPKNSFGQPIEDPNDLRSLKAVGSAEVDNLKCVKHTSVLADTGDMQLFFCENSDVFYQIALVVWSDTPEEDKEIMDQILSTFKFLD